MMRSIPLAFVLGAAPASTWRTRTCEPRGDIRHCRDDRGNTVVAKERSGDCVHRQDNRGLSRAYAELGAGAPGLGRLTHGLCESNRTRGPVALEPLVTRLKEAGANAKVTGPWDDPTLGTTAATQLYLADNPRSPLWPLRSKLGFFNKTDLLLPFEVGTMNGEEREKAVPRRIHPQARGLTAPVRRRAWSLRESRPLRSASLWPELTRRSFARIDTRRPRFAGGSNRRCGEAG